MEQANFFYERPMGSRFSKNQNREPTPHEVLGIPHNSDDTAIKNAYRKLARQWHPDKNPGNGIEADKKFKEINDAYEKLTKIKANEINFEELFSEGLDELFGGIFQGMMQPINQKYKQTIIQEVSFSLEELYKK